MRSAITSRRSSIGPFAYVTRPTSKTHQSRTAAQFGRGRYRSSRLRCRAFSEHRRTDGWIEAPTACRLRLAFLTSPLVHSNLAAVVDDHPVSASALAVLVTPHRNDNSPAADANPGVEFGRVTGSIVSWTLERLLSQTHLATFFSATLIEVNKAHPRWAPGLDASSKLTVLS